MKKEDLQKRVNELSKAVNESLENHQRLKTALDNATHAHNALVGRLDEAVYLFKELEKAENEKANEMQKK